ncbi:N-acetylmuramoyl-L-alanine amidase [Candidatus Dojkabacteria bacterium]|jgi:hypothetical protein|nr:N-acetylmuramoyl-L-alanine amidase [Candidatus Dojkabacteria bacterium]
MKILIIAGHQNVQYNSITSLHGNTGTLGELEINIRIASRLSSLLREKGFEVVQSDANANDNPTITGTDFNLALALHCDMDTPNNNGGGMIASGDPAVDSSWQESARIRDVIKSIYFTETKIVDKNYTTLGMTKYYMWQYLSNNTPCVLIEMGQAKDPHDSVLLANTDLIAGALSKSICKAFNVVEPPVVNPEPPVTPEPAVDPCQSQNEEIRNYKLSLTGYAGENTKLKNLLNEVNAIVFGKWTWVGVTNGWKKRLSDLKELLA